MLDDNPVIINLPRQRDEQIRSEAQETRRQALHEAQARLEAEQSIEAYERYLDELTKENDGLRVRNQALRKESGKCLFGAGWAGPV